MAVSIFNDFININTRSRGQQKVLVFCYDFLIYLRFRHTWNTDFALCVVRGAVKQNMQCSKNIGH